MNKAMLLAGSIIMFCMLTCIVSVRFYGNINITQIYMRSSILCSHFVYKLYVMRY